MQDIFFFLSKILVYLIYPLGLALVLILAAYAAALLKKRVLFHLLFAAAVLVLYLFSIDPVADFLLRPLESEYLNSSAGSALKADAIVVLSGDVRKKISPRADVEVSGNRVLKGVRLFRQGAAPVLIMTGGSGELFSSGFQEAVVMKELAVELGVPKERVMVEVESRNTRENAVNTKKILDGIKGKKIILVTSALHLPRSVRLFTRLGVDVLPVATDFHSVDEAYDPLSFFPKHSALVVSSVAVKEYVGLFMYRLMGWI